MYSTKCSWIINISINRKFFLCSLLETESLPKATFLSTFLRDYVTIAMVIILVTMATAISSLVKDKNMMKI